MECVRCSPLFLFQLAVLYRNPLLCRCTFRIVCLMFSSSRCSRCLPYFRDLMKVNCIEQFSLYALGYSSLASSSHPLGSLLAPGFCVICHLFMFSYSPSAQSRSFYKSALFAETRKHRRPLRNNYIVFTPSQRYCAQIHGIT